MKKGLIKALAGLFCLIFTIFIASTDERPKLDIVLVLDRSLSMIDKIETVKNFVISDTLGTENVKIGDYLVIINFYGQAEVVSTFPVETEADRQKARDLVSNIFTKPKDTHTDIGNAMDIAKAQLEILSSTGRPKILFLMTDGRQEAYPGSKYFTPDFSYSHPLLENARTIAKEGWKIQIVEIGGSAQTKELTEKLGGTYSEVSEQPTAQELAGTVSEFRGIIQVAEVPTLITVPATGEVKLTLPLKSQGFSTDPQVLVKEARIISPVIMETNILGGSTQFTMPKEGELPLTLPLSFPLGLEPGDYQADISFMFDGDTRFTPNVFGVTVHVNSFIENNLWLLILIIIAGLLLITLIVFLIMKLLKSRGVKFKIVVEEHPLKKGSDTFSLSAGKCLYLNESMGVITIVPNRSMRSYARIAGVKGGVVLDPIKDRQFIGFKRQNQNIIGHQVTLKSENSVVFHINFQSV